MLYLPGGVKGLTLADAKIFSYERCIGTALGLSLNKGVEISIGFAKISFDDTGILLLLILNCENFTLLN